MVIIIIIIICDICFLLLVFNPSDLYYLGYKKLWIRKRESLQEEECL